MTTTQRRKEAEKRFYHIKRQPFIVENYEAIKTIFKKEGWETPARRGIAFSTFLIWGEMVTDIREGRLSTWSDKRVNRVIRANNRWRSGIEIEPIYQHGGFSHNREAWKAEERRQAEISSYHGARNITHGA